MEEVILSLFLFLTIAILVALIFISYNLYVKRNKTEEMSEILATKESDLIDLYNLLENMINEVDETTKKAVEDIYQVRDEMKKWRDEMYSPQPIEEPAPKSEEQKVIAQPEQYLQSSSNGKCKNLKEIKIKALYSRGVTIPDIAREMNIGQGEVQLILNLEKKIV